MTDASPLPAPTASLESIVDLDAVRMEKAEKLAAELLSTSLRSQSRSERRTKRLLARLLADPDGRDFLLDLTDRVLRIRDPRRAARALTELSTRTPGCLPAFDRAGMRVLGIVAQLLPKTALRLANWRVGLSTAGVILPAGDPEFKRYLARRARQGFRLNVNVLGESILSDAEAEARTERLLEVIERPDVTYVSVKVSAVCANLDILAEDESVDRVCSQLRRIYRAARDASPAVFVNMDMEEYRDLELSLVSFMRVLDEPEFDRLEAGIVLQAYIPDSHEALLRLCRWASARFARTGTGIKVRLVKGANLAMEQVEAELHDWVQAPYGCKAEVDASYKRMLDVALSLPVPGAVRLGVASHNLFEVAWALTLRDELADPSVIEIEMLEGMAPSQARAVRDYAGSLLLYAPVVTDAERDASIAYLSRRLDENAAPENFLRSLFSLTPGSSEWVHERERFRRSVAQRFSVRIDSRRTQSRDGDAVHVRADGGFANAADTDFTRAENRAWIAAHLASPPVVRLEVVASVDAVDDLVARARVAHGQWVESSWDERRRMLASVVEVFEDRRGELLALLAHASGKTVREADPEVSEAVDFARYAAHLTCAHELSELSGLAWEPYPVVLVAGPWNFPFAIPACGVVHALAAGSAVLLKPAPEARAVAAFLVELLREAGVPGDLVQLAPVPDDEVGRALVTHEGVDLVVLTGSGETADMFLSWKPSLRLHAETSGKNAVVVTAAADVNQAIKDLVKSAFGHAGQKCSAASLAIVEASVYDDPVFRARLADATRSLAVGSAVDLGTVVGPLVGPPAGKLLRALTELDEGESWLVEPVEREPGLWSPGVRDGVQPGSWFHLTECFGPVLGLMRADDLEHALKLQNQVAFGLTGGIQSLDVAEVDFWLDRVQVGNAYVNRGITGAVVSRQPFGGWKASTVGPSPKPGGPHHLHAYGRWYGPLDLQGAEGSYASAAADVFLSQSDEAGLACEANWLRYRPLELVVARVASADAPEVPLLELAARIMGVELVVSSADVESDELLAGRLAEFDVPVRLRLLTGASDGLLAAAHGLGVTVDDAPVTCRGDIELVHWVREQSVSVSMHRYGRLLRR